MQTKKYKFSINQLVIILTIITAIILFLYPKLHLKLIRPLEKQENIFFQISGKAKIIDGDSLIINNIEIRIKNIDAVEMYQTCQDKDDNEYACGIKATNFLKEFSKNKIVKCNLFNKDVYNRHLGNCHIDGKNIAAHMIKSGWALIYNLPSPYANQQEFAKTNKLGIWQGNFIPPKTYRRLIKDAKMNRVS